VAQVFGVRPAESIVDALCAHLRQRQLLPILTTANMYSMPAKLADAVLRSGADTTIVATSREPLHVAGEQTYPLCGTVGPSARRGSRRLGARTRCSSLSSARDASSRRSN
jgi:predicted ATPase